MYIDRMKRGTGRTHNMIVAAIAYAVQHGTSTVVLSSASDVATAVREFCNTPAFKSLRDNYQVKLISGPNRARLYFKPINDGDSHIVYFVSAKDTNIEWYQFRVIGVEQKATFFDHHAIESHFAELLDRWTRYDNKLSNLNAAHAQRHFENEQ